MVGKFADCLKGQLAADTPEQAAAVVAEHQAQPVQGLSMGLGAMWRSFLRLFGIGKK
jgi:hypothetical protein